MVSILMPVRNAAPFLRKCLDSILNQTLQDWELIAVNDGSTDESSNILEEYRRENGRIQWLNNNGSGIIDALRLAYSTSSGEFITRMDADDIMPDRKLAALLKTFKDSNGHVATGLVSYFDEQDELGPGFRRYEQWLNSLCREKRHYEEIYKECVIPSPCWMMHRTTLDEIGSFESSVYPEDYDLVFRLYKKRIPVIGVNQLLHYWRDHGERASRNDPNYADHSFLDLKLKYFSELDLNPEEQLFLWGAGAKGKRAARFFIERSVDFQWISDNPRKVGKDIYGKIIRDSSGIRTKAQVLILVANPNEQEEIRRELDKLRAKAFWFC